VFAGKYVEDEDKQSKVLFQNLVYLSVCGRLWKI
jgi:hypothetical protein